MKVLFGKPLLILLLCMLPFGCESIPDAPIPTRILMLGDSLTAGGHWNTLTGRADIRNEGLGGATTQSVLNRFDNELLQESVELCFLMIGTNDIGGGISVPQIKKNIELIINGLEARNIQVVIQSTLFVSEDYPTASARNEQIELLNNDLKAISEEKELPFLDLNEILAPEGYLLDRYTQDGIHLMEDGYRLWVSQVLPIIDSYGI